MGGVDVTLIDYALSMTPLERLKANDHMVNAIVRLRDGAAAPADDEEQSNFDATISAVEWDPERDI